MKILQVNCVYPLGSTGKIVDEIHKGIIAEGHESLICYGRGKQIKREGIYKTSTELYAKANGLLSRVTGIMYAGAFFSTAYLIHLIKKQKPDIVHLHCINNHFVNIYKLVEWLKKNQIKTVITHHAEFYYTANCGHAFECERWKSGCGQCPRWKKVTKSWFFDKTSVSYNRMKRAFEGFGDRVVCTAVSPWVLKRSKESLIMKDITQTVILNGVNTEVFAPKTETARYRQYGVTSEKIIFHVTAHFTDEPGHAKGGWAVLELARRLKGEPVKLFVAAGRIELTEELPENVVLLGHIKDQNMLAEYYSQADLTVITSKKETFSMPCAESLCCGTPVAGFQAGGPESISLKEYSDFVEYGNLDKLEWSVRKWLEKDQIDNKSIRKEAEERYSNKNMVGAYLKLYEELL